MEMSNPGERAIGTLWTGGLAGPRAYLGAVAKGKKDNFIAPAGN